jgi:hypothetical protein
MSIVSIHCKPLFAFAYTPHVNKERESNGASLGMSLSTEMDLATVKYFVFTTHICHLCGLDE